MICYCVCKLDDGSWSVTVEQEMPEGEGQPFESLDDALAYVASQEEGGAADEEEAFSGGFAEVRGAPV